VLKFSVCSVEKNCIGMHELVCFYVPNFGAHNIVHTRSFIFHDGVKLFSENTFNPFSVPEIGFLILQVQVERACEIDRRFKKLEPLETSSPEVYHLNFLTLPPSVLGRKVQT